MTDPILYVSTEDGLTLPVVDLTHPAFAVHLTEPELAVMAERYILESAERPPVTPELAEALKRSRLGRGLMAAANGVLGGIETYMMKVGPGNLTSDAHPLDRAIAASFPALTTRLRLLETAQLLAAGLARVLPAHPGSPIACLNIGGGVGADSWNALLLLQAAHPELMANRTAAITLLDVDAACADFGERAIAALRRLAEPSSRMSTRFHHVFYDWSDAGRLSGILASLPPDAVCVASSEGALFEYGTDQEIVENLRQLRLGTPAAATIVGTVTRDSPETRASRASTRVATVPRSIEAFRELASAAGWQLETVLERPFSYHVRLAPI